MKYMLAALVCILGWVQPLHGQLPFTISGIVADEQNRPLPGTSVTLSPGTSGVVTNTDGRYSFTGLPPGTYVLQFSFLGYEKRTDTLRIRNNTVLNIALERSLQNLQEVVVTGDYAEIRQREESLNLEIVNETYLRQNLGGSLMKSLDKLPGVDAMGIGSGQSKPVIRGLSFNRVVVVENGIKHEGQQWGSDHGLEIDQYGVDRVEVIKGPSSLLHGSDAIGGVIVLDPPPVPEPLSWGGSVDLTGNTNNHLLGGSLRLFVRKERLYASVRGSYLDYGDIRVPADSVDIYSFRAPLFQNQVRNTAGKEGTLHLETGWIGESFSNRLFFSRMELKNGFFANAHGLEPRRVDTDLHDRSSRDIQYPYHRVSHWKVINRSAWRMLHHTLELELGVQQNFRQEWSQYVDHGYMPPLFPDTLLFPSDLERQFDKYIYSGNLRHTFRSSEGLRINSGIQAEIQQNEIDGRGFIIPAFDQQRLGGFVVLKKSIGSNSLLSGGLRYDMAWIRTHSYEDWFASPVIREGDTTGVRVQRATALNRQFSNLTWTFGYTFNSDNLVLKANLGKSFRVPLPNELAANGINYHYFRYEVGDPGLDPETAYQLDAGLEWRTVKLAVGMSPFVSYFPNYIYLNPGYEFDRLYGSGNQVFTYTQSQVVRYGGEVHAHYEPISSLVLGITGEYIYSRQLSGEKEGFGLPFSPPANMLFHVKYTHDRVWNFPESYIGLDLRVVAAQNRIVPPEDPTPGYQVLDLVAGTELMFGRQTVSFGIQVLNLFNRAYFDHTSFYRLVNVPEPGRSVVLNVSIPINGSLPSNSNNL
jgi:iron complex outermembrane receptor protein